MTQRKILAALAIASALGLAAAGPAAARGGGGHGGGFGGGGFHGGGGGFHGGGGGFPAVALVVVASAAGRVSGAVDKGAVMGRVRDSAPA